MLQNKNHGVGLRRPWIAGTLGFLVLLGIAWAWRTFEQGRRISELTQQCIRFESRGRWDDLERAASEWHLLSGTDQDALFFLGKSRARKSRLDEVTAKASLEILEQVTDQSTRYQETMELKLGLLFGPANQPHVAAQLARDFLKAFPKSGPARLMYGNYLLMMLDRKTLIEQVYEALKTGSDVPVLYGYLTVVDTAFLKDRTAILQLWSHGPAASEDVSGASGSASAPAVALQLSQLLDARVKLVGNITDESQKTVEEAVRGVEDLLKSERVSPDVIRELLQVRMDAADVTGVSQLLQIPIAGSESDPYHWRARGWYRSMVEEYGVAEEDLMKAKQLFPMSWRTHNELASLYRRMGKVDEATRMQNIADKGRELDAQIRSLDRINDLDRSFLENLQTFAKLCGDESVLESLNKRLAP